MAPTALPATDGPTSTPTSDGSGGTGVVPVSTPGVFPVLYQPFSEEGCRDETVQRRPRPSSHRDGRHVTRTALRRHSVLAQGRRAAPCRIRYRPRGWLQRFANSEQGLVCTGLRVRLADLLCAHQLRRSGYQPQRMDRSGAS